MALDGNTFENLKRALEDALGVTAVPEGDAKEGLKDTAEKIAEAVRTYIKTATVTTTVAESKGTGKLS